jgi:twitching motility protein PilT
MTERTGDAIDMIELLRAMVGAKASDLHVKAGAPPGFRIDGSIAPQAAYPTLTPAMTAAMAEQLMDEDQRQRYAQDGDLDFSYAVKDLARFRVNVLTQRGSTGMVLRQISDRIPTADDLGLPEICKELAMKPRGLVLVTGPTGSGKSTTLAAMIDHYNSSEAGHILTMEDPLEFVHKDKKCFVTQRQIGSDCKTFQQALRRALRQDPDVILIGEMRDLETIALAITAAETGHLVFGTLHTTSAISTVDRIIDVFPPDAQQQVRIQLSATLQGVISQCLLPKIGGGRAAAREILVATDGVRSLIREGKTAQLVNLLQTGSKHGMWTLEQELCRLVSDGTIRAEDAIAKANRPGEVQKVADGVAAAPPSPTPPPRRPSDQAAPRAPQSTSGNGLTARTRGSLFRA